MKTFLKIAAGVACVVAVIAELYHALFGGIENGKMILRDY